MTYLRMMVQMERQGTLASVSLRAEDLDLDLDEAEEVAREDPFVSPP